MMIVKTSTFCFLPESNMVEKSPHKSTNGATYGRQVTKAAEYVKLNMQDLWSLIGPDNNLSEVEALDNEYAHRFFMTGQMLSNRDVIGFVGSLQYKYKQASIKVLNNSLGGDFEKINEMDPFFVVTGIKAPSELDQKCLIVNKDLDAKPEKLSKVEKRNKRKIKRKYGHHYKEHYIAYPFVYPGNTLRPAHIVLILIDQEDKKIFYYDPQGLTSNDPCRMGIFDDNLHYNMHNNLKQLSEYLFGNEGEVTENISPLQSDPVNCGVFVCRALRKLFKGKAVLDALNFNATKESISTTRKQLGLAYMRTMRKQYPPTHLDLKIIPDFYQKPETKTKEEAINSDVDGWAWED